MAPKILIVSNEIRGLGHVSIALKICAGIRAELADVSMLLITASPMAHAFPLPQGLDVVKIPGLREGSPTDYRPSRLPLGFGEVKRLRQRVIREAALAYSPDLVSSTIGRPASQASFFPLWRFSNGDRYPAAAALEKYDEIWVYGCQNYCDPIVEYQLPETVARKVIFCGYLDIEPRTISREDIRRTLGAAAEPLVLVTIANGRIGFPVLDAWLRALAYLPSDLAIFGVIIGAQNFPSSSMRPSINSADLLRLATRSDQHISSVFRLAFSTIWLWPI